MKTLIKYLYLFIVPMVLAGALLSSCDDDEQWRMAESLSSIMFELQALNLPIR